MVKNKENRIRNKFFKEARQLAEEASRMTEDDFWNILKEARKEVNKENDKNI